MPIDPINSSSSTATASSNASALPAQVLNQQDFLKLLVTQLSAQDPMNPQTNTEFAAQMAQFSALQTSMQTQAELTKVHADQQAMQANNLIGRTVTVQSGAIATSGTVSAVQMDTGTPMLLVNGVTYDLSQVTSIQPAPPAS